MTFTKPVVTWDADNSPKFSVQNLFIIPKARASYFMDPQSPWGELLTFKKLLGEITKDLKEYFDFIGAWLSSDCTHDEKK